MNFQFYFKKWWVVLLNGLLLIFLSYFLFSNPYDQLLTSGVIIGFIALLTGTALINGYLFAGAYDKYNLDFFFGISNWLTGLFFLSGIQVSQTYNIWLFFAYMLMNSILLVNTAWHLKTKVNWWWLTVAHLFYTILVGYFLLSGNTAFDMSLTTFTGLQFIINGFLIAILSLVLRNVQLEYNKAIRQMREEAAEYL